MNEGNQLSASPTKQVYWGIFLLALVTLMFEVLLTRVFSVMIWYHFAFMAISVAMFGMAVGAMRVFSFKKNLSVDDVSGILSRNSLYLAISIVAAIAIALQLPVLVGLFFSPGGLHTVTVLAGLYILVSLPFFFSGVCVSLILSYYSSHSSRLYAADLIGAALGCVLLLILLNSINTLSAVFIIGALAACASLCFSTSSSGRQSRKWALVTVGVISLCGVAHHLLPASVFPLMRITTVKFHPEQNLIFDQWNSYSRITVIGDPKKPERAFVWGPSKNFPLNKIAHRVMLTIDGSNGAALTEFHGDLDQVSYLRDDLVNLGHMLKSNSSVMVIGVGGGRDILSALAFKQKEIVAVEINGTILQVLTKYFGDFTGHLDRYPQVKIFNDEGRSYLKSSNKHFDIIQISMIDTQAATAAGGFVLTENSLFTSEAWTSFLQHLNPNGLLTVSRWYSPGLPSEAYRITSLAMDSLKNMGVKDPRRHILMARVAPGPQEDVWTDVATIAVSPTAFSDADVNRFENLCQEKGYTVVISPKYAEDKIFDAILSDNNPKLLHDFPLQVTASTDDNPYFFQMLKLDRLFDPQIWADRKSNMSYEMYGNIVAVILLEVVLVTVTILATVCIVVPALRSTSRSLVLQTWPLSALFFCMGLGFMFIEVTQMQRLILLLGHPIYGLSVILFSLLTFAGLGSYFTSTVKDAELSKQGALSLASIPIVLAICGAITPNFITQFESHPIVDRVIASIILLAPMGFTMGMAFPLSMRMANRVAPSLTAWLWGINGATSVWASILAVVISFSLGVSASYWTGCMFYLLIPPLFLAAGRLQRT